ncbi:FAD-dependent monooxygenase [Rhizomonospora bruguierae]|uniref:FAD-dependent monooxygenase n=1 Tax=Rhizomonospora bruguierae TaxID=1581705 RepID=UPI001BD0B7F0|nr:FAD-dependent monooxygenase [Micromonospora sp. NBRC 107566]
MVDTGLRVLIVGAGIAGLAVARSLRVAGYRPDVVERHPAGPVAGAGIYLPGNALRALRELGLAEPLRPFGATIDRQVFRTAAGEPLCELDVAELWSGVGECRALSRADLHRVMLTGAGGAVRFGIGVTGLVPAGEAVDVSFSDGSAGVYDLVIGADGRRSTVRDLARLGGPAKPVGQFAYRSVISGAPGPKHWTALFGERAGFVAMPMGAGQVYCYAEEAVPPGAPAPQEPLCRFRELFGGYGDPVPGLLEAAEKVAVAVIEEVDIDRWYHGRVVLIGDAAHATSPNLAQGAAMALEDALVLADALVTTGAVPAALAVYEARRRPRTKWLLAQTRRRDRTRDLTPALRDPMIRRLGDQIFAGHYRRLLPPR